MAPHAELSESTNGDLPDKGAQESAADIKSLSQNDYYYTYDNRDGYTSESTAPDWQYVVAEHILWAPRRIRVASIGAGASGIMLCYKKEKEFGDDIDLVVYDREAHRVLLTIVIVY